MMDDSGSILVLLWRSILRRHEYPRHFGSRDGPCTIYEPAYRTFSLVDRRVRVHTYRARERVRATPAQSVITSLMDDGCRARMRNTGFRLAATLDGGRLTTVFLAAGNCSGIPARKKP